MSQENVDVIGRIYAAWASEGSPVPSGLLDSGMDWVEPPDAREDVHIDEILDAGDRVVVLATLHEDEADADAENRKGYVWTLRDGKAIRFDWFNTPDDAMRAAGVHC